MYSTKLADMAEAAKNLNSQLKDGSLVRGLLETHEADIMEQQHRQLLEGKDSNDNDLRPYYTEDIKPHGYFKSQVSAANYMAWKDTLNYPYEVTRGNSNAPNLYVDGRFYSEMQIKFGTDAVAVAPRTPYAAEIMGKYGKEKFGLSIYKWGIIFEEKGVKAELVERMKELLYGN